jgi:hypothetical protein
LLNLTNNNRTEFKARHLCRYTLTVDKIKNPDHIIRIHQATKPLRGETM